MATSIAEIGRPNTAWGVLVDRKSVILAVLLLASFVVLYQGVIAKLVNDWYVVGDNSHSFLVLPLALYFAWERRHRFFEMPHRPSLWGLVGVLGSLGILVIGVLGTEYFATRVSMIGVAGGSILFLFGWQRLRVMLFPLTFLLLMIPIPAILYNQITLPLQFAASAFAEYVLNSLQIPALREGNVIHLPYMSLEVEEACSGIRSLVSLVTLGIVYGYFLDSRRPMRLFLTISMVPIAVLANAMRVAGTGAAAHRFGPQAAEGFLHTFSGWLVFVAACVLLMALHGIAGWLIRLFQRAPAEEMR